MWNLHKSILLLYDVKKRFSADWNSYDIETFIAKLYRQNEQKNYFIKILIMCSLFKKNYVLLDLGLFLTVNCITYCDPYTQLVVSA